MSESRKRHLLIVEDNLAEYMPLQKALAHRFPKDTDIYQADTYLEGVNYATRQVVDAVLVSFRLPDGTAADLIEALEKSYRRRELKPIAFFLMFDAAQPGADYVKLVRQFPEITLVEKPYIPNEVAKLVRDMVLPAQGDETSHYNLGLYDLIQAYVLSRQNVTLRVMDEHSGMGTIAIRGGNLVHAARGPVHGLQALAEIAQMRKARIRLERGCHTAMETITLHPQEALCEAARIIDEQRRKRIAAEATSMDSSVRAGRRGRGAALQLSDEHTRVDNAESSADTSVEQAQATMNNWPRNEETLIIEPADTDVGLGFFDNRGPGQKS
ncbi:MAG: DUF4388 domain-containing protein [Candidatus Sumerlaeia bacterium]|nr:DUF4388 domain-containing protein [Candidatus Sumerlaeia bacterium]